jgi:tetratricopeptide (TPR) repeat protein
MGDAAADRFGTLEHALANAGSLAARQPALAIEQLTEILKVEPANGRALAMLASVYQSLGDQFTVAGDTARAAAAYAQSIRHAVNDPRLQQAAGALCRNDLPVAERLLRDHLRQAPTDVAAIRMLAEVGARLGRHADAENLLHRALELSPDFEPARHNLAIILFRQQKLEEALAEIGWLLDRNAANIQYRNLKAAILARLGEYRDAIPLYRQLAREMPGDFRIWLGLGHSLRSAGQNEECVAAYRRSIDARPAFGEAWWSLANLKTFHFGEADVTRMEQILAGPGLFDDDRLHFHFALGKACEDRSDHARAFGHYTEGNRIRRAQSGYSADETAAHVARSKALFTPAFFDARRNQGHPDPAPVFIVGLPRSGSTLIEQILSSHSQVEGTMELPDMAFLARRIAGQRRRSDPSKYPDGLADLDGAAIRALGEEYIARTRIHRKSDRPFFIDKMPNNFAHVGMIHLILPKAKVIDARRHPLGACVSAFRQHFARGQTFSYSLEDLGRYYRDYVDLMGHIDNVLPGRVHRIHYERLVDDLEGEVRRLLDYCGLPFEEACLSFHTNTRAVRTASSEQVRRPLYRDAIDQWKNYEPWLQPLKEALGPVLQDYPAA